MSIAQTISQPATRPRWLLLGSLALHLFFIGVAVALAIRAPSSPSTYDRDVFVRIERVAASLPPADGAVLRTEIESNHAAVQDAQRAHRAAQNVIRDALRQDPFDPQAM